jgi:hypothetical protein
MSGQSISRIPVFRKIGYPGGYPSQYRNPDIDVEDQLPVNKKYSMKVYKI